MPDPWTLYWQADRLDSADALKSSGDYDAIRACWADFASVIGAGAQVLDLATGNGTVPAALLAADSSLKITGVDRADIDPHRYVASSGDLSSVEFRGGVDILELPFDDAVFDAVTSQFGIEYAALDAAIPESLRVLKPGGAVQFILHRSDSEVVEPSRLRRAEMDALLADGGVLQELRAFVKGATSLQQLEQAGQSHLDSEVQQSAGVSGQIFGGVKQVIEHMRVGRKRDAAELCETMLLRLGADRQRLLALEAVGRDQAGFDELQTALENAGVQTLEAGPLCGTASGDDEFVIGWLYRGRKN
jgi:ubiquinone/menaquinone biosynthesis C-methylase UbiE